MDGVENATEDTSGTTKRNPIMNETLARNQGMLYTIVPLEINLDIVIVSLCS
jgi:hypothetical protein